MSLYSFYKQNNPLICVNIYTNYYLFMHNLSIKHVFYFIIEYGSIWFTNHGNKILPHNLVLIHDGLVVVQDPQRFKTLPFS